MTNRMEAGPRREEKEFKVEYANTASDYLIGLILLLYIPLLVAPLTIIRFNFATSILMAALLLALAFGVYVFRGNPTRRKGTLSISPGDARIHDAKSGSMNIRSNGMALMKEKTLRYRPSLLFETRIRFESEQDWIAAWQLLKQA